MRPLHRIAWNELLATAAGVTPFAHPDWVEYQVATTPGAVDASRLFCFADGVEIGLPLVEARGALGHRTFWGLRHDEYGALLVKGRTTSAHYRGLYSYLAQRYRPVRLTLAPGHAWEPPPPTGPWRAHTHDAHVLTLPDTYEQWRRGLSHTCRANIRRAERAGLRVSTAGTSGDLDAYYRLYTLSADRWGTAAAGRRVRSDFERLLSCPLCRLLIVYCGDTPAAGILTLEHQQYTVYYLGASDRSLSSQRAPYLGFAELIRRMIADGHSTLNFGASMGIASLERFKENFGARRVTYSSFYVDDVRSWLRRQAWYYRHRLSTIRRGGTWG